MRGKTKTILTIIIAILVFAVAVVGTVTFLKDDGETSAAEGTANTLPVTGADDEQTNTVGGGEDLDDDENPTEQTDEGENEEPENPVEGTDENQGTTENQGTGTVRPTEPESTTIEQERLVSTTLNWSRISLNSTIGRTGINYTNLGYTIKYYQVVSEEETNLINTETGKAEYGTTVTVTEDQIKENCPEGYKLDETSELSTEITENVNGNVIEVYYVKDYFDLTIEYEYEDGTPASDPYEESVEFEGEYSVPSPEIPGYTPSIEVVEGTMPGEDETVTVVYTPNTDVSYTVRYLEEGTEKVLAQEETRTGKTFAETYEETAKDITGYTVVGEATQTITLDAYNKELTFYYTKNSYDLTIEYEYEDGTPATEPYEESVEFEGEYSVESPEIPGYTPSIEVVEGTMPAEDETITVIYTPKNDVNYTVKYLEQGTENELASEKLVENKTFGETYTETAKDITGYTVVGEATQTITLDAYGKVLTFYYTKNQYAYTVEYYYENVKGEYIIDDNETSEPIEAYYQDVISTFKQKTKNDTYVLNQVEPADENGNAYLVITTDTTANVLKVYYERNTFDYKVVYYKDSVNENNYLGESKVKEQKVGTVMTEELVTTDLGAGWINAFKPTVGYQDGEVDAYITIEANDNNVINVVYKPRIDIPYSVEYYFNGKIDKTKGDSGTATYGSSVTAVKDYSNNGEWTVDEENSTKLPFVITAVSGNVIKVYYVKPVITVEKTSTVNTDRTTGAENTVEPGETITYTITATNNGSIAGKVTISDPIPGGTILTEGTTITATGYENVTVDMLTTTGIELTVPANGGTASVQFTVTVTANAGNDAVNTPNVNGTPDTENTVTNPVEKTIQVKAKTQTIQNSNIVIVLDTSISMEDPSTEASDTVCRWHRNDDAHRRGGCIQVNGTWYEPKERMDVAKEVVNDFIDNMNLPATSTTDSCAVTVVKFNRSASVVGTASTSAQATALKNSVTDLNMGYYTNMTDALELAEEELKKLAEDRPNNANIVIFVSDGEPTIYAGDIPSAASSLKSATLADGTKLNPTVYTVAFGSDIAVLRDTIATDSSKYYTTETSGSLADIFSSMQDSMTDFAPTQSSDGLVELTGIYVDATHPIKITVNGTPLSDITTLPTDNTGYVIVNNGTYYLNLAKFNATDTVTIEYYSNN